MLRSIYFTNEEKNLQQITSNWWFFLFILIINKFFTMNNCKWSEANCWIVLNMWRESANEVIKCVFPSHSINWVKVFQFDFSEVLSWNEFFSAYNEIQFLVCVKLFNLLPDLWNDKISIWIGLLRRSLKKEHGKRKKLQFILLFHELIVELEWMHLLT